MQSQVLLSLVVPFYNAADYFGQLLASVETQLTDAVQIVLVCDGATDNSLTLAQQHIAASAKPGCYLLLTQANSGVSAARNLGIAHSTGCYIGFLDADDVILPGYMPQLLHVIAQHQPDLIEIGYKRFSDISALPSARPHYMRHKAGKHKVSSVATAVFQSNRWFPWLRIYRKAIAPGFNFPSGIAFCEDVMAIPTLYQQAFQLYHLRLPLYGYREHSSSASFNVKPEQQQQLQQFFTGLQQGSFYPAIPTPWRNILLLNLAYLFYSLQLNNPAVKALPVALELQSRTLLKQLWLTPGFSLRKKLTLMFASHFFRKNRAGTI
ncbi:glycosyltransferase involved in cell wall biosynthesis [Rheinheimera pacifica]|uniref:glycosyltransferase family 2 protein n=1 Tax=Rheinheimera pacifica TaxID=173990 RepID=UPI002168B558|nr:glycosyltransferase [Rheinheimera pacifica]MCS4307227.1 glycosyltransferase involved in cell wall biosynthesis [Rheinheimera pacifica]